MKNLNCKNCGAAMMFDSSAMTASCRFCGTKYVLSREDTDYFNDFYSTLSGLLGAGKNEEERKKRAEKVWEMAEEKVFECSDGTEIGIRYLHFQSLDSAEIYTARRNIAFHFKAGDQAKAERFRKTVSLIDYPSADTKHLANFFPNIIGGFTLSDGSSLLVISKDEDEYPLCLFSGLDGRHAAWIISRIENLCCVLEYNGIVHPQINPAALYINPYLHQANLYGGWWLAGRKNSMSADGKMFLKMQDNLTGLRNTAANVLGFEKASDVCENMKIPKALSDFIRSAPCEDAYDDFSYWDKMLIRAYGERKFIEFETDDEQIYGKDT